MIRRVLAALSMLCSCKHVATYTPAVLPGSDAGALTDAGGESADVLSPPPLVMQADRISVGGGRSFLWARTGTEPEHAPLLMVLHGDGGNGTDMRGYVGAELERLVLGQAHVVYPDGVGRTWDTNTAGAPADNDYLEAVRASFAEARKPRAIYLFGYSRGGFMANMMACQHGDWVTAIASNAGGAPYATALKDADGLSRCPGEKPVASIALHGTEDTEVAFADAPWTGEYWAHVNGCNTTTMLPTTETVCKAYANCPAAAPSWFCAVPGVGHAVWGQAPRVAWEFFKALP